MKLQIKLERVIFQRIWIARGPPFPQPKSHEYKTCTIHWYSVSAICNVHKRFFCLLTFQKIRISWIHQQFCNPGKILSDLKKKIIKIGAFLHFSIFREIAISRDLVFPRDLARFRKSEIASLFPLKFWTTSKKTGANRTIIKEVRAI